MRRSQEMHLTLQPANRYAKDQRTGREEDNREEPCIEQCICKTACCRPETSYGYQ